jgi:hypothetical protein
LATVQQFFDKAAVFGKVSCTWNALFVLVLILHPKPCVCLVHVTTVYVYKLSFKLFVFAVLLRMSEWYLMALYAVVCIGKLTHVEKKEKKMKHTAIIVCIFSPSVIIQPALNSIYTRTCYINNISEYYFLEKKKVFFLLLGSPTFRGDSEMVDVTMDEFDRIKSPTGEERKVYISERERAMLSLFICVATLVVFWPQHFSIKS